MATRRTKTPKAPEIPPRVVLGFDPGTSAACVALSLVTDSARFWRIRPKRLDGFPVMDLALMARTFKVPPVAFVEHLQGRGRGWSATANFSLGAMCGGVVTSMRQYGWDVRLVRPQAWQKVVHQFAGQQPGNGTAKERSLAAYRTLFPDEPLPLNQVGDPEHNTIDALLIAFYGVLSLGVEPREWIFNKGR